MRIKSATDHLDSSATQYHHIKMGADVFARTPELTKRRARTLVTRLQCCCYCWGEPTRIDGVFPPLFFFFFAIDVTITCPTTTTPNPTPLSSSSHCATRCTCNPFTSGLAQMGKKIILFMFSDRPRKMWWSVNKLLFSYLRRFIFNKKGWQVYIYFKKIYISWFAYCTKTQQILVAVQFHLKKNIYSFLLRIHVHRFNIMSLLCDDTVIKYWPKTFNLDWYLELTITVKTPRRSPSAVTLFIRVRFYILNLISLF